jgi:hypothetical protein
MSALKREDLYSLEEYAALRQDYRRKVMEHKKTRQVHLGDHATLYFEDQLTMQYQIQEMLRIEKIFEAEGINEELETYNALIPDGNNWKATFMIEYSDVEERQNALAKLIGIEKKVWVKVGNSEKVYPISNEDLDRETETKTSAVHFMRFELSPEMVEAVKADATISMGIEHVNYSFEILHIDDAVRASLKNDLN